MESLALFARAYVPPHPPPHDLPRSPSYSLSFRLCFLPHGVLACLPIRSPLLTHLPAQRTVGDGGGPEASQEGYPRKLPPSPSQTTAYAAHVMSSTTCIPSRVLYLPAPLLQPRGSRWASVQPSPDRASLLLCGRHECQLLAVSSFALQVPHATVLAQPSISSRGEDTRRQTTQQWNEGGSVPGNSAVGGRGRCIVLPQPHRDLTSSCWLSAGLDAGGEDDDEAAASDDIAPGAVVGLGDATSAVTIMRPSPVSRALSPHGTVATWLQATIFLKDEEDAVFASGTPLAWHHQHHVRLDKATALGRPCHSGRAPPVAPAWKAVEAVLPCSYLPSHSSGGLTDMYVVCQRVDDLYVGSGIAARGHSARRSCNGVWLASVQRESAWRVPLAMPPGDDEDVMDSGGDGAPARSLTEVRRTPRLFDVRRRLPHALKYAAPHKPAHQRAGNGETGPMGLVFAAAFRRHVGLYTAATATPTVFFGLPSWLTGGGGTAASASSPSWCSGWSVTSVVEEPSLVAPAAVPQTSSNGGGSGYSYLVTAMHHERGNRRSRPYSAHAKVAHGDASWQADEDNNSNGSCWWLLYDCRNPSLPVWAAEEALTAPPALDEDGLWHDAPVVTEWLASTSPSPASHTGLRRRPVCATYVPLATTSADGSSALAALSACGVCVVLDGGTTMPDGAGLDAEDDDDDVEGREAAEVFAPIMYELSPPRSLLSPTLDAPRAVTAKPPRVRALTFTDGVLHYACEEVV
ncbi:conserved hypothetical protein [Leishmania mexicana MHOM/GT/2001/U1103]|uniref:Uncharacterized protein n=1 Tax=Leishmania mexicana (strain MHOM/GT/2001/U1103) TaxID=929439 RepID=E9AKD6_LEIMU|nr:conserved hypothetical protein [Leishmania mexicana MHOM/GT/2001/U1103]CBZ23387.1 conserved hypothetical protein [Leishmania mexicana MHOM/GT/2001/U1103]